jgi:RNA polymerase sigma-70 factor (ECF subfamily)
MASRNPDSLSIALAAGDEAAFTRVVEPLGGRLFRSAVAILGNREDAEDVVQEVLVALVQSRRRLVEIGELDAYLFASLRHGAVRCAVRRQKDARR